MIIWSDGWATVSCFVVVDHGTLRLASLTAWLVCPERGGWLLFVEFAGHFDECASSCACWCSLLRENEELCRDISYCLTASLCVLWPQTQVPLAAFLVLLGHTMTRQVCLRFEQHLGILGSVSQHIIYNSGKQRCKQYLGNWGCVQWQQRGPCVQYFRTFPRILLCNWFVSFLWRPKKFMQVGQLANYALLDPTPHHQVLLLGYFKAPKWDSIMEYLYLLASPLAFENTKCRNFNRCTMASGH